MRIGHIADLHIGKIVNGFSMIDQQRYVLNEIIIAIKEENLDCLLIAGDIYDKRNPSDESVSLFNNFINELSLIDLDVLIISGNHDSGIKLGFGNELLKSQRIFISGSYEGSIDKVVLKDDFGSVNFYLLPFIRVSDVRVYDESIKSYHDAVEVALKREAIDYSQRNVIVSHQFYSSGQEKISDSEIIAVGGTENVGYNLLLDFDYAALGHLHKPQKLKEEHIRYSGSIVTYSYSEHRDQKQMVIVELKAKGDCNISFKSLNSSKQFISKKGYLDEILKEESSDDYMFITLLDEDVVDAIGKLRAKFPNLMTLDFDNKRTESTQELGLVDNLEDQNPLELFKQFYKLQNNNEVSHEQEEILEKVLERINDHETS